MRTAFAAQHWQKVTENAADAPYLMYDAIDDDRTRPAHHAWDNTVLRYDDPWWQTHYPPNGWNCRCSVIQLSDRDLTKLGKSGPDDAPFSPTKPWQNPNTGAIEQIPVGIDPGWDYHPGRSRAEHLSDVALEKIARTPADLGAAVFAVIAPGLSPEAAAFSRWVDDLASEAAKINQERRVVGAISPLVLEYLEQKRNTQLTSAAVIIVDTDVRHLLRPSKQKSAALPIEVVRQLPRYLRSPQAALWDLEDPALIYVLDVGQQRAGKIIVRVNYESRIRLRGRKRETVIENRVRSGGVLSAANLKTGRYELIEGQL